MFGKLYEWWARFEYRFIAKRPLSWVVLNGRLRKLTFRRSEEEDIPRCIELYQLNEPGRFPPNGLADFEKALRGDSYHLVTELDGKVVAMGGVSYWCRRDIAVFSYGLVDPAYHGQGIGTTLFLARLGMIEPQYWYTRVVIFAVDDSITYYQRFGFKRGDPWEHEGEPYPTGHLIMSKPEIRKCRRRLKREGIVIPDDRDRVPLDEFKELPAPPEPNES